MTEFPDSLTAQLEALRTDRDVHATDVNTQRLYEAWAQREDWRLDQEAVPLVVGVDPARWTEDEATAAFTLAVASDMGLTTDARITPLAVRRWAQTRGIRLPQALARLLDFITSVLPQADAAESAATETEVLRAQERETLLGAALMLVTKEQAACLDEDGYYSPIRIARLIRARAVLWFPLTPPTLDETAIAALIARWIAPPAP